MFLQIVLNSCAICCCKRCANNIFDKSSDKRWNNGAFWLMKQVRDGLTLFQERIRTTGWKDYNGLPFKEKYSTLRRKCRQAGSYTFLTYAIKSLVLRALQGMDRVKPD